jgi:hypothetical protein
MSEKKVFESTEVKIKNIVLSNFIEVNDENIVSKIWYKENENSRPQTLNIQTGYLKIKKIVGSEIYLYPGSISGFMDSLDQVSLKFISGNEQLDRFNIDKLDFKTILDDISGEELLKFDIVNGKRPTFFYSSRTKSRVDSSILANSEKIKVIFELNGLIINKKDKVIYNNIILRDVLVSEAEPKLIELTEYSFIDNDTEKDDEQPVVTRNERQTELLIEKERPFMFTVNSNNSQSSESSSSEDNETESRSSDSSEKIPKPKPKPKPKQKRSNR